MSSSTPILVIVDSVKNESGEHGPLAKSYYLAGLTSIVDGCLPDNNSRVVMEYTPGDIIHGKDTGDAIKEQSEKLLGLIQDKIKLSMRRDPIIFIGQGLGGTIIKQSIVMAANDRVNYEDICFSASLFIFLQYPHQIATPWEAVNCAAKWLTPVVDSKSPFLLQSIEELAATVVETNELFLETRIPQISKVASIFFTGKNTSAQATYSLGILHETLLPITVYDSDEKLQRNLGSLVKAVKESHVSSITDLWLPAVYSFIPPIQKAKHTQWKHKEASSWLENNDAYIKLRDRGGAYGLLVHGPNNGSAARALQQSVANPDERPKGKNCIILQFTFEQHDARRNTALLMATSLICQILVASKAADLDVEIFDQWHVRRSWSLYDALSILTSLSRKLDILCLLYNVDQCETSSLDSFIQHFKRIIMQTERQFKLCLMTNARFDKHGFLALDSNELGDVGSAKPLENVAVNVEMLRNVEETNRQSLDIYSNSAIAEDALRVDTKAIHGILIGITDTSLRDALVLQAKKANSSLTVQKLLSLNKPITQQSLFQQILSHIDQFERNLVKTTLSWILFALRPLSIQELATVIAWAKNRHFIGNSAQDRKLCLQLVSPIVNSLPGILEIDSNEVRVVHPAIRNFFFEQRNGWFSVDAEDHRNIVLLCLEVLQLEEFQSWQTQYIPYKHQDGDEVKILPRSIYEDRSTLHWYITLNWPEHFRLLHQSLRPIKEVEQFFAQTNKMIRAGWAKSKWMLSNHFLRGCNPEQFKTPLPLLAEFADEQLFVDGVKELGELAELSNDFSSAIAQAASMNSTEIVDYIFGEKDKVQLSLEQAFSTPSITFEPEMLIHLIQATPDNYAWPSSLMVRAAELGQEGVIKALLNRGCSPNIRLPHRNMTPLLCAASNGHATICDLLLAHGAEINACPGDATIIDLAIASPNGGEVVKLLRRNGIDVTAALRMSCTLGHFKVLEAFEYEIKQEEIPIFLSNRYIIEAIDLDFGFTAAAIVDILGLDGEELEVLMPYAIDSGSERAVRLLLTKGVEARDDMVYYACRYGQINQAIVKLLVKHTQSISSSCPVLTEVAEKGHLPCLRYLIDCGFDVNVPSSAGLTPLMMAARQGHLECARCLLDSGADVNWRDEYDEPALYEATANGHFAIAQLLLDHGAVAQGARSDGGLVLHLCSSSSSITQQILEQHVDVNVRNRSGSTPLHTASENGHADSVNLLIEHNAALEPLNKDGHTPLALAVQAGKLETIHNLLEGGADVNFSLSGNGCSALHYAKSSETIGLLLQYGANVNSTNKDGQTPLICRAGNKQPDISSIKRLVIAGAFIDQGDNLGCTPLFYTVLWNQDEPIIDYFLSKGADPNSGAENGLSPLHQACYLGDESLFKRLYANSLTANPHTEGLLRSFMIAACCISTEDQKSQAMVRLLVEELNADVNDLGGSMLGTVLNAACLRDRPTVFNMLVDEYNANLHLSDTFGRLPIHLAATRGIDTFRQLLDHGCDLGAVDKMGRTVLQWASQGDDVEVLKLVLSQPGVDVDKTDKDGWTALCWAARAGRTDNIKVLLESGAQEVEKAQGENGKVWTARQIAIFYDHRQALDILEQKFNAIESTEQQQRSRDLHSIALRGHNHGRVLCDYCRLTIVGSRYRCTACFDFDFCFKCYKHRAETHASTHDFDESTQRWDTKNFTTFVWEINWEIDDESSIDTVDIPSLPRY